MRGKVEIGAAPGFGFGMMICRALHGPGYSKTAQASPDMSPPPRRGFRFPEIRRPTVGGFIV